MDYRVGHAFVVELSFPVSFDTGGGDESLIHCRGYFGLALMSVSIFGGLASLAGAYMLWPTVMREHKETSKKRTSAAASSAIIAFLVGPLIAGIVFVRGNADPALAENAKPKRWWSGPPATVPIPPWLTS